MKDFIKFPFSVSEKVVDSNSAYYTGCSCWIYKKCCGLLGQLKANPDSYCRRYLINVCPVADRKCAEWFLMTNLSLKQSAHFYT